ncbi:hypothetical protein MJH12_12370, partial [bacterium]|nr:hypothetical protein [bacterium]
MCNENYQSDMRSLLFIIEKRVLEFAINIKRILGHDLSAVILGGGYGRAEGGICRADGKLYPYNDLDLFLVLKSKGRLNMKKIFKSVEKLSEKLRVKIDIGHVILKSQISNLPHTLMYHDLFEAHKVVYGEKSILFDHQPSWKGTSLPKSEVSQYLLNRGYGLIQSLRYNKGIDQTSDKDYIKRNVFKAIQAIGDCILIEENHYDCCVDIRLHKLRFLRDRSPEVYDELYNLYYLSIEFKKDPESVGFSFDIQYILDFWIQWFLRIME